MENTVSERLESIKKSQLPDNKEINHFVQANEEYHKMLESGMTLKRGFNILTTEEIYNPANYSYSQTRQEVRL